MRWTILSVLCLGGLALVGACSDDTENPGPNNQGDAGAGGVNGAEAVACPTALAELKVLGGKACDKEGAECLDPGPVCEHNFSYECTDGKWEALTGLAAPCGDGGAGGVGGAGPEPFVCPTDAAGLQALEGKACATAGQLCDDPAPPCEHNFGVECIDGKWEQLVGLAAPCGGAGGQGGGGAGGQGGAP